MPWRSAVATRRASRDEVVKYNKVSLQYNSALPQDFTVEERRWISAVLMSDTLKEYCGDLTSLAEWKNVPHSKVMQKMGTRNHVY